MHNTSKEPIWYRNLKGVACGTTGGIAVTLAGHPFDTLKVRLQTQSSTSPVYTGLIDCVRKTLKWEGVRGLYKGVASPICGQIFFRTTLFTSYYESVRWIQSRSEKQKMTPGDYFLAGAITGFFASFSDSPIDLFKTKMQFQIISETNSMPVSVKYRNVLHCFVHTVSTHGIRGVYQGLGATIARDIPGYAVYFGVNETMKMMLAKPNQSPSDIGMLKIMFSAGVAGIAFWTSIYAIDVIKSAMMADDIDRKSRKFKNMFDCALKLYREEGGIARFGKGFVPCMIRGFLANALMLYVVDITRKYFPPYHKTVN